MSNQQQSGQQHMSVNDVLQLIRTQMPETYQSIQRKAKEIGNEAFSLVRRGIKGEAGCFYAFERGHVVGTPFNEIEIDAQIALTMVTIGLQGVCVWPAKPDEQKVVR